MILGDYSLSRLPNKSIIALYKGSVEAEEKTWLSGDIDTPVPMLDFPPFRTGGELPDFAAKIGKCRAPSKWLSRG